MIRRELQGATRKELAREFGLTPQAVYVIQRSELYRKELNRLQQEANEVVKQSLTERFKDKQDELVDQALSLALKARSESVRLKGVWEILDRLDKKPQGTFITIGDSAARALMEALRETRRTEES